MAAADGTGALEEGVAASLREVAAELRATRAALERLGASRPSPTLPPP